MREKIRLLQREIIDRIDLSKKLEEEELKEVIDREISRDEQVRYLKLEYKTILRRELFYEIRQLGFLQELLGDEEITEIMVNGTAPVFIEKGGKIHQLSIAFDSPEKLRQVIQQIVSGCNRTVNEASPIVDARLNDGSRVNAVLPPIALDGPILTIRRFSKESMTMQELIEKETVSKEVAVFLEKAVKAGCNILISGGTGCGKTTFLNALSAYIPERQRVITIEDSAELKLQGLPNLVRLETRNMTLNDEQAITIRDLLKTSLRMRPDRLIVGEVRGSEAVDMLQSMNVGHSAMSTIHANSVRDVVSRLETMVLMGMELPISAVRRQILSAFDLFIHLGRMCDGSRKVLEIAEPDVLKDGEVRMRTLYLFEEDDSARDWHDKSGGRITGKWVRKGELKHVEKLKAAGCGG